ncbi:serine/threonine-protein kinase [Candidatus Magnetominusculus xianensis]|uniref:Serine/threonine-protein kinase n=1 Tax=Candidatus Magnetominusculus xianensis TaxID=1748249 RepID=A0ABR5SIL2_9BACT|nr:serine/threonine-protein kinase [Candidatus Magnetominusculus xianensis]KWT91093.1 serine/threonine-protein kinase [Candidatus Magnetominusculus xianensis]MBF0403262.1 protein kinase [Nitrospirota bacterium]
MMKFNLIRDATLGAVNIGRYQILHELGQGAMGVVYKGRDSIIDRIVAIKTIRLGKAFLGMDEKEMLRLFYQEVRIAGNLSHPNIATIYDAGESYDIHYFVMEFVDGIPLKSIIQDKVSLPLISKVKLLVQVASALQYAHLRGVIHRDIKPANIMLVISEHTKSKDYQAKIMDFGIAMLSSSKSAIHRADRILGTPSYMSPEQVTGGELDRQTDVFSLGAMSYEFLTGRKPFPAADLPALFTKIRTENPPPPNYIQKDMPLIISNCIMKAMEKDKEKRLQSAGEFADEMEIYLSRAETQDTQKFSAALDTANREFLLKLKKHYAFFADFSLMELNKIYNISSKHVYKKDEEIFREGSIGKKLFIIMSGRVKITKMSPGNMTETLLNVLKPGDCFGEMSLMDSAPRFATATADSECSLVAISEVVLRNSEPMLCLKLYKNLAITLSDRLRKSDEKVNALLSRYPDTDISHLT